MGELKGKDDNSFTQIPNSVLESEEFIKTVKGPFLLYFFLLRRIVRWYMKDGLYIYENYHENGYLACSMSYTYLSKALNVSLITVKRWAKHLEKNGFIEIKKVRTPKGKLQNVYILGTHNKWTERFSIKDLSTNTGIKNDTPTPVSNMILNNR